MRNNKDIVFLTCSNDQRALILIKMVISCGLLSSLQIGLYSRCFVHKISCFSTFPIPETVSYSEIKILQAKVYSMWHIVKSDHENKRVWRKWQNYEILRTKWMGSCLQLFHNLNYALKCLQNFQKLWLPSSNFVQTFHWFIFIIKLLQEKQPDMWVLVSFDRALTTFCF